MSKENDVIKRLGILMSATLLISAAPPLPPEAMQRFESFLMDPRSAQIDVATSSVIESGGVQESLVCGRFNAKNSYGGYIGFKPFVYRSAFGGILYSDGVVARANGTVDSLSDIMSNDPKTKAELDLLTTRGDALILEINAGMALCKF